jgi:hypothetical protein
MFFRVNTQLNNRLLTVVCPWDCCVSGDWFLQPEWSVFCKHLHMLHSLVTLTANCMVQRFREQSRFTQVTKKFSFRSSSFVIVNTEDLHWPVLRQSYLQTCWFKVVAFWNMASHSFVEVDQLFHRFVPTPSSGWWISLLINCHQNSVNFYGCGSRFDK